MVVAIDEVTGGEVLLHDVLSIDQEDPGTKAARKMDWEQFMAGLSARDQALVSLLIEGKDATSIAKELRVCSTHQSPEDSYRQIHRRIHGRFHPGRHPTQTQVDRQPHRHQRKDGLQIRPSPLNR